MSAPQCKLCRLQVERTELVEADGADTGEFIEELRNEFAARLFEMAPAIELVEWFGLAIFEDSSSARQPVLLVCVDEMADHIGNGKGAFAFITAGPGFR